MVDHNRQRQVDFHDNIFILWRGTWISVCTDTSLCISVVNILTRLRRIFIIIFMIDQIKAVCSIIITFCWGEIVLIKAVRMNADINTYHVRWTNVIRNLISEQYIIQFVLYHINPEDFCCTIACWHVTKFVFCKEENCLNSSMSRIEWHRYVHEAMAYKDNFLLQNNVTYHWEVGYFLGQESIPVS